MPKKATGLQRIIKFIDDNKISEMIQWSNRKRYLKDGQLMRYIRHLIKQIRLILNLISGNDIIEMLKGKKIHSILSILIIEV